MNYLKILPFVCLAATPVWAQHTKTMDLSSFSKIRILGCVTAELRPGDAASLKISAKETIDDARLTVEYKGDELIVRQKWEKDVFKKGDCRTTDIRLDLTYLSVDAITSGVGAELTFLAPVKTRDLDLNAMTGSQIKLEADVRNLKARAVEGAIIRLSGKAEGQQVTVTTGGELHAYDMNSEDAFVKANTGGVAEISTSERLDASASTGGAVRYRGNPAKRDVKTSLGGEVSGGK
jgi:hypothetical protein